MREKTTRGVLFSNRCDLLVSSARHNSLRLRGDLHGSDEGTSIDVASTVNLPVCRAGGRQRFLLCQYWAGWVSWWQLLIWVAFRWDSDITRILFGKVQVAADIASHYAGNRWRVLEANPGSVSSAAALHSGAGNG